MNKLKLVTAISALLFLLNCGKKEEPKVEEKPVEPTAIAKEEVEKKFKQD